MIIKPLFYLLITILVWGSSFQAMSYLLKNLHPMELALSRFLLPGILGLLYFLNSGQTSVSAGTSSFIVNCNSLFAF